MDFDGQNQENLTQNSADDGWADWSPDGTKIAFSSDRNLDKLQIHIMDINTKQVWRLTSDNAVENHATWSPDGKKIAFASNRDGNWDIYIINADGTGSPQNLTNTNQPIYNDYPAWSPDGKKIVFASSQNSQDSNKLDIYIMNKDGSNRIPLDIDDIDTNNKDERYPAWSSDSREIVFAHGVRVPNTQDIYTVNANGGIPVCWTCDLRNNYPGEYYFNHPSYVYGKIITNITSSGGTVNSPDGSASVFFPPEAVPYDAFVSILKVDEAFIPPPPEGWQLLGDLYDFSAIDAEGNLITNFSGTLEVTIQYDPNDLNGLDEQSLTMFYYGSWVPIPSTVDTVNHTVTAFTDHFSLFGIFGIPEPSTILLFGTGLISILIFARRSLKKRK